jgi:hypothetical protein
MTLKEQLVVLDFFDWIVSLVASAASPFPFTLSYKELI